MLTKDAVKFFGDQKALAAALGIKTPSVYGWGDRIPPLRQLQIEKITGGKLKADPNILPDESFPSPQHAAYHGPDRRHQMRG